MIGGGQGMVGGSTPALWSTAYRYPAEVAMTLQMVQKEGPSGQGLLSSSVYRVSSQTLTLPHAGRGPKYSVKLERASRSMYQMCSGKTKHEQEHGS